MLARVVDALWHNIAGAVLTSTLQPHDGLSIVNCDVFFARHVKATKSILMSREQTAGSVTQERVQRDATVRLPFLSVVAYARRSWAIDSSSLCATTLHS